MNARANLENDDSDISTIGQLQPIRQLAQSHTVYHIMTYDIPDVVLTKEKGWQRALYSFTLNGHLTKSS
jgi:hypothetical protein